MCCWVGAQEQADLLAVLHMLKVPPASSMAATMARFGKGVRRVMHSDSHLRNATINLPASPSLPNAVLDARQFI